MSIKIEFNIPRIDEKNIDNLEFIGNLTITLNNIKITNKKGGSTVVNDYLFDIFYLWLNIIPNLIKEETKRIMFRDDPWALIISPDWQHVDVAFFYFGLPGPDGVKRRMEINDSLEGEGKLHPTELDLFIEEVIKNAKELKNIIIQRNPNFNEHSKKKFDNYCQLIEKAEALLEKYKKEKNEN